MRSKMARNSGWMALVVMPVVAGLALAAPAKTKAPAAGHSCPMHATQAQQSGKSCPMQAQKDGKACPMDAQQGAGCCSSQDAAAWSKSAKPGAAKMGACPMSARKGAGTHAKMHAVAGSRQAAPLKAEWTKAKAAKPAATCPMCPKK